MQRGLLDPEKVDPFSLFLESGAISHCLYRESDRILGNTYSMCILQVRSLVNYMFVCEHTQTLLDVCEAIDGLTIYCSNVFRTSRL